MDQNTEESKKRKYDDVIDNAHSVAKSEQLKHYVQLMDTDILHSLVADQYVPSNDSQQAS